VDTTDREIAEDPLGKRYPADKLAILCATRPSRYVLIRILAAIIIILILSFAIDFIARLAAWTARSGVATFIATGEIPNAEDRGVVMSLANGFPYDLPRLISLGITLAVLTATQLLATRNLPPGLEAMKSSVLEGPPWPGRWRLAARYGRILRPWLITASGIAVVIWLATMSWPLSATDWGYIPALLLVMEIAAWAVAYAGCKAGGALTALLPSFAGISASALREAKEQVERKDKEAADRRWPHRKEFRLPAAARVFSAPPAPARHRRQRRRHAWWCDTDTSVEALATELVLQALIEARDLGLVSIANWYRRNPRVIASLPPEEQPHGLAALVAGFHREGLAPGRVVNGKVSDMLSPFDGVDQYANVITTALEDLESWGVASKKPGTDTWQLSAERLKHAAAALPSPPRGTLEVASDATPMSAAKTPAHRPSGDTPHPRPAGPDEPTAATGSTRELAALRRSIARQLRHKRTTEAEADNLLQLMFLPFEFLGEQAKRHEYQLPESCVDS